MKYLLVLGVVLFGVWLWRHNRQAEANGRKPPDKLPRPERPAHRVRHPPGWCPAPTAAFTCP
jgi:hypothetical protein